MASGKWLSTKNSRFSTRLLFVIFFTLLLTGVHRVLYFNAPPTVALSLNQVKTGDLIFRQGKGLWSPYFAGLNAEAGYSHIGVLERDGKQLFVLHSDADDLTFEGGAQRTALPQFIADSLKVEIRSNLMSEQARSRFVENLQTMVRHRTPFDGNFDLKDEGSKVYCTEFLWVAANKAGISDFGEIVNLAGREVIFVDSFFHSKWLSQ